MDANAPLIRASYAKTVIGGIKRRAPAEQARLLASVGDGLRQEVRGYGMLDWMPAKRFADLVGAISDALGPAAAKDFWRDNLLLSLDRRLLNPLRLGAIAVYGNSPRSLLKMTPQAWQLIGKHAGICDTVDLPPSGIVLRFTELPLSLRTPGMSQLWSGGSESCIAKLGYTGHAKADATRVNDGIVTIHVEWKSR